MTRTTTDSAHSFQVLTRKSVTTRRLHDQLMPLIEALADCSSQEKAVEACREFLSDTIPATTTFHAAAVVTGHVIAGFGAAPSSCRDEIWSAIAEAHSLDDDPDLADELTGAIERGLSEGAATPWCSLETQARVEVEAKAQREGQQAEAKVKTPEDYAADVRAALELHKAGDPGAIFSREVYRAASKVKFFRPDELVRLTDEIAKASSKRTAAAWEREFRAFQREEAKALRDGENSRGQSAEKLAVEIVRNEARPFCNRDGTAFVVVGGYSSAEVPSGAAKAEPLPNESDARQPQRVFEVGSSGFTNWLTARLWTEHQTVMNATARATVEATVRAIAAETRDVQDVHIRVATVGDTHYVDMCDDKWRVIEIKPGKWKVLDHSPIMFVRPANAHPLPVPNKKGEISRLWDVLNIHKKDRVKILAWLCSTLRTGETYPILAIQTRAGSGKSTVTRFLRRMFDPSRKELSRIPRNADDMLVAAVNNYAVVYDNIDSLSSAHQDTLCTISTGTALGGRKLYSNHEESSSAMFKRPVILNGINAFVTRTDLASRSIIIDLPRFEGSVTDSEVEATFAEAHGDAFGGLLNVYAAAMSLVPEIERECRDTVQARAVAFAYLGEAVSRVLGGRSGEFLRLLKAEQDDSQAALASDDPVGAAICEALAKESNKGGLREFSGYIGVLASKLQPREHSVENWPRSARGFANRIRHLEPALSVLGIKVEFLPQDRAGIKVVFRQDQKAREDWLRQQQERHAQQQQAPAMSDHAKMVALIRQKARNLKIKPNRQFYGRFEH